MGEGHDHLHNHHTSCAACTTYTPKVTIRAVQLV